MCKGRKKNIVEITKLSNLLKTQDSPLAIIVGKQHTRWSCLKTPICGACGTLVQIAHANFEAQQFEQNRNQMNCVVL